MITREFLHCPMCSMFWIVHHKKTHVQWNQTSADCCHDHCYIWLIFSEAHRAVIVFFSKHRIGYLHVCALWRSSLCRSMKEFWEVSRFRLVLTQVNKMFERQHNRHDVASFCYTKFPYRNIICMIILWISWERRASRSVRALLRALFRTHRG